VETRESRLLDAIEQQLWHVGQDRFGDAAARSSLIMGIQQTSRTYTSERDAGGAVGRGEIHPAARLLFFTPADLPKLIFTLAELASRGRIQQDPAHARPLRVLDLGAGHGAQTLGLLAALDRPHQRRPLTIDALDRDGQALDLLEAVVSRCRLAVGIGQGTVLRCAVHDLAGGPPPVAGPYDLVLLGNLLNELPAEQTGLVERLLALLAPQGHLILIEPALRETARRLHRLRDDLLQRGEARVFAPCTRQGPCPALDAPGDWCHERRPWTAPPRLRALARAARLRQGDLKWSYLTLTRDPATTATIGRTPDQWRAVSDPLPSKGKLDIFVCGEQGRLRAVRLNRHRADSNRQLQRLRRGRLATIQGGVSDGAALRLGPDAHVTVEDPAGGGL